MQGTVKFFNEAKGFGFITPSDSKTDIFVHVSGLLDEIRENDEVTYEVESGKKGMNAVKVERIMNWLSFLYSIKNRPYRVDFFLPWPKYFHNNITDLFRPVLDASELIPDIHPLPDVGLLSKIMDYRMAWKS